MDRARRDRDALRRAGQRANVTPRPGQLRDPNLDDPTVARWFDVGAFAGPPVGRFGTSAKGVVISTPINVFHASLAKQFLIKERVRLRFEVLGTNVLNHPNYAAPKPTSQPASRPRG